MRIFANSERLLLNSWNIGHGNKILHLYFVINYAHNLGLIPTISCDSSLDDIFDLSRIKSLDTSPSFEIYKEESGYPILSVFEKIIYRLGLVQLSPYKINDIYEKSKQEYKSETSLLTEKVIPNNEGFLSGHYWHYELMPSLEIINTFIHIKPDLIDLVDKNYPRLSLDEQHVAVHIRETDFKHHLRHIFKKSIALPDNYYKLSSEVIEKQFGSNITYHIFSDNMERAKRLFNDKKAVFHNDSAVIDWVGLHMATSIIQSNSSFCWSASLHNKKFSVQPKGGFNWNDPMQGTIPYGFEMPNSHIINCSNL